MPWWAWMVMGFGLILLELLTPVGFHLLFVGVGALVVGGLVGLVLAVPAWMEWLLFSGLSHRPAPVSPPACHPVSCWWPTRRNRHPRRRNGTGSRDHRHRRHWPGRAARHHMERAQYRRPISLSWSALRGRKTRGFDVVRAWFVKLFYVAVAKGAVPHRERKER
jgi:hypothetical protein